MLSDPRLLSLLEDSLRELAGRVAFDADALVRLGETARLADLCEPDLAIDVLDRIADLAPAVAHTSLSALIELELANLTTRWDAARTDRGAALAHLVVARDRAASLAVALGYHEGAATATTALVTAIGLVDRHVEDHVPQLDAWGFPDLGVALSPAQAWIALASEEPATWWCDILLALVVRAHVRRAPAEVDLIVDWLAGAKLTDAATWLPLPIRGRLARALAWEYGVGRLVPRVLASVTVPLQAERDPRPPFVGVTPISCDEARATLTGLDEGDEAIDRLAIVRLVAHDGHCVPCAAAYVPRQMDLYLAIACAAEFPAASATTRERTLITELVDDAWGREAAAQCPAWLHPPARRDERRMSDWIVRCGAPPHALAILEALAAAEPPGTRTNMLGRAAEAALDLGEVATAARLFAATLENPQSSGMRALCEILAPRAHHGEIHFGCPAASLIPFLDELELAGVGRTIIGTLAIPDIRALARADDPIEQLDLLDRVVTSYIGVLQIMRGWVPHGKRKHSAYHRLEQRFAYPSNRAGDESILRSLWLWCKEHERGSKIVAERALALRLGPLSALFRVTSLAHRRTEQIKLARALADDDRTAADLARTLANKGQREKNRIEATLISRALLYYGTREDSATVIAELENLRTRCGALDSQCLWYLGRAYLRVDRTKAAAAFRAAVLDLPDDARPTGLLFLVGATSDADATGDVAPGLAALEALLARDPTSDRARFVYATLLGGQADEVARARGARELATVFANAPAERRYAIGLRLAASLDRVFVQPVELGLPEKSLAELYGMLGQQRVFRYALAGVGASPGTIRYLSESLVTRHTGVADWQVGRAMLLGYREPWRACARFFEDVWSAARRERLDGLGRAMIQLLAREASGPTVVTQSAPRHELAAIVARIGDKDALRAYLRDEVSPGALPALLEAWPELASHATLETLASEVAAFDTRDPSALVALAVARELEIQGHDDTRSFVAADALQRVLRGAAARTHVTIDSFESFGRYGIEDDLTSLDLLATAALTAPTIQARHRARVGVLDDDPTIEFVARALPDGDEPDQRTLLADSDRLVIRIGIDDESALDGPLPRALLEARNARRRHRGWSLRA